MSVKLNSYPVQLQIDPASNINLISQKSWKTVGQPLLTSTRHVVWSASKDCQQQSRLKIKHWKKYTLQIWGTFWDLIFIESLGLLSIVLNFVCNAVSKSSAHATMNQTGFSPIFTVLLSFLFFFISLEA